MMRDTERKSSITDNNNQDGQSGTINPEQNGAAYQEIATASQPDDSNQVANFVNEGYLKSASLLGRTDPTAHISSYSDGQLAEFFKRKVRVNNIDWPIGNQLNFSINPQNYWQQPSIIKKLDNYYMISYTLNVEVVINATPFHYDKLILYARPCKRMTTQHDPFQYSTASRAYIQKVTHLMNVVMDVSTNESGALELPFIFPYNYQRTQELVNGADEDSNLWNIGLASTSELGIANPTSSTNVNVGVYMWATDVQLVVPTQAVLQSDNNSMGSRAMRTIKPTVAAEDGPITTLASSASSVAKAMTSLPVIGQFAGTVASTIDAVGGVAAFFGLSRPPAEPTMSYVKMKPISSLALVTGEDNVEKLSTDHQQGTSIDPGIVGTNGMDEMSFASIIPRESLIAVVDWQHGIAVDSRLFWCNVNPFQANPDIDLSKYCLNPLGTVAAPFKYWSGSIKFRFSVVRSAYHNGRIRLTYDPRGASPNTEFNTSYSKIVDISETPDFEFCVPWAQITPYQETDNIINVPNHGVLVPPTYVINTNNGRISLTVVNELTSPDDTSQIQINVYMSGGEDFEVGVPDNSFLLNTSQYAPVVAALKENVEELIMEDPPQLVRTETVQLQSTQGSAVKADTLFGDCADAALVATKKEIFFGETYGSFKPLLKRYAETDQWQYETDTNPSYYLLTMFNTMRPCEYQPLQGGMQYYAPMSPYELITNASGFYRGGVRWKYIFSDSNTGTVSVKRNQSNVAAYPYDRNTTFPNKLNAPTSNFWRYVSQGWNAWDGETLATTHLQQGIEVEIPFYTPQRFVTTNAYPEVDSYNNSPSYGLEQHGMLIDMNPELNIHEKYIGRYFSTAEDFQTYFFMGNGPLYVRDL